MSKYLPEICPWNKISGVDFGRSTIVIILWCIGIVSRPHIIRQGPSGSRWPYVFHLPAIHSLV